MDLHRSDTLDSSLSINISSIDCKLSNVDFYIIDDNWLMHLLWKPNHQFSTASQIKWQIRALVCVYILAINYFYSHHLICIKFAQFAKLSLKQILPCSILLLKGDEPGHEAWGLVPCPRIQPPWPLICPECLRRTLPWSSMILWITTGLTTHSCGSFVQTGLLSKYSVLSQCVVSLLNPQSLCTELSSSLLCHRGFYESVATITSHAVHVLIMARYWVLRDLLSIRLLFLSPHNILSKISLSDHSQISNHLACKCEVKK